MHNIRLESTHYGNGVKSKCGGNFLTSQNLSYLSFRLAYRYHATRPPIRTILFHIKQLNILQHTMPIHMQTIILQKQRIIIQPHTLQNIQHIKLLITPLILFINIYLRAQHTINALLIFRRVLLYNHHP
jgi:hypothetical protein